MGHKITRRRKRQFYVRPIKIFDHFHVFDVSLIIKWLTVNERAPDSLGIQYFAITISQIVLLYRIANIRGFVFQLHREGDDRTETKKGGRNPSIDQWSIHTCGQYIHVLY